MILLTKTINLQKFADKFNVIINVEIIKVLFK